MKTTNKVTCDFDKSNFIEKMGTETSLDRLKKESGPEREKLGNSFETWCVNESKRLGYEIKSRTLGWKVLGYLHAQVEI